MITHWTEFQGKPNRTDRDKPRVTLNKRGVMLLNRVAHEAMGAPAAVRLFFDENIKAIGLKAAEPEDDNSFPVKQKNKQQNRVIHINPLCKHYGIKVEKTVLFTEVEIDPNGLMRLELRKTVNIGHGVY